MSYHANKLLALSRNDKKSGTVTLNFDL